MDHMNTFVPVFPVDWSFPLAMDCIQLWIGVIQVGTNAAFLQTKPSRRVWIHVASEVNTTQSNELVCTVHYGADKKQVMTRAIEVDPTTIQNIGIGNTVLVHNSLQNEQITISVSGGEKNTAASLLVVVLDME
jgi:5-deoxy-D-glucuronate isomerase